jgi:hypothetical protein
MKHGLPPFIGEVNYFEIPAHRYTSISRTIYEGPENVLGI